MLEICHVRKEDDCLIWFNKMKLNSLDELPEDNFENPYVVMFMNGIFKPMLFFNYKSD
jgi:hypothetical protein